MNTNRINRATYILSGIVSVLVTLLIFAAIFAWMPNASSSDILSPEGITSMGSFVVFVLVAIAAYAYNFLITIKRLHDVNWHGAWSLLLLINVAGTILWLILAIKPGDEGENDYGQPPAGEPSIYIPKRT